LSIAYSQERSSNKSRELQDVCSLMSKKSWRALCQPLAPAVWAVAVLCCYLLISSTELGKISHVKKQIKQDSFENVHAVCSKWADNENQLTNYKRIPDVWAPSRRA